MEIKPFFNQVINDFLFQISESYVFDLILKRHTNEKKKGLYCTDAPFPLLVVKITFFSLPLNDIGAIN